MNVGNTGGRRDCKSSKTAATADCSHSKDSCKNVNSGKNINKSKMKTTQIQPKHQGGTQTTAGMSEPVETSVAEGMLARRQGQQQEARTAETTTIAGTRGLLMAARTLATAGSTPAAEATGTPRDPSHVSRDARNMRGRLS